MAKTTIDFQAFRKERQARLQSIVVRFSDTVSVELPSQMPATVMLDLMAFHRDQQAEGKDGDLANIPPDMAVGIMTELLGNDQLSVLIRDFQLDMGEMFWLLEQLMTHYMDDVAEVQQGKAPAVPKANRSTSSTTGTSSKRDSGRSTASP